jgi:hypothetical protein
VTFKLSNVPVLLFSFFFFLVGLGFEFRACAFYKAGTVLLEPHLQSIRSGILEMGSPELFAQADLERQSSQS